MATPFAAQCSVAISNDYGIAGTFIKSQLTISILEEWIVNFTLDGGGTWNEMSAYRKTQFMMAACGLICQIFYDWIMFSAKIGMGLLVVI